MTGRGQHLPLTALDWSAIVRAGDMVVWPQAGAEPVALTRSLMAQRHRIGGFRAAVGLSLSDALHPDHADSVSFLSYCGSGNNAKLVRSGALDILPLPYTQFAGALLPVDVLLLQVPPPNALGWFSPGIALEYIEPLISAARFVVAQVNDQAPAVPSGCTLQASDFDYIVEASEPLLSMAEVQASETDRRIAGRVADLVEDGATLQAGIGRLPDVILSRLTGQRDLGIHSGALGDWAMTLTTAGALTNAAKPRDQGTSVCGILMGSQALYDFAHENAAIRLAPTSYTHDPEILAALPRLTAINSAIEVDLTGQINAETAGGTYVGAVGGAAEFLRGAHRSPGGLPIVALASTVAKSGKSRIVDRLSEPVSTCRSDAGLIVTEHGVADLRGKTLAQRRELMLAIAAPEHRAALDACGQTGTGP